MEPIEISVIISTYNRDTSLKDTIESLLSQSLSKNNFEIIIVDNNSNDNTSKLASEYNKNKAHSIRYVLEKEQGLSKARNRGSKEAKGEIITFIDDDAIADKYLLEKILDVYDHYPQASIIGGKIKPVWSINKPSWLTKNLETYYSLLDLGDEIMEINFPQTPFGCNFSIKRQLFLDLGGFSADLGRTGTNLLSGEEIYLCYLSELNNNKSYYVPKAIVYHRIPPERLNRYFLIKRSFYQGISNIVFQKICKKNKNYSLLTYLTKLKNIIKNIIKNLLRPKSNLLTEDFIKMLSTLGSIYELSLNSLRPNKRIKRNDAK